MYLLNLVPNEKSHFKLLFCMEKTNTNCSSILGYCRSLLPLNEEGRD